MVGGWRSPTLRLRGVEFTTHFLYVTLSFMSLILPTDTTECIHYATHEVDRDIGAVNSHFMVLDNEGPIGAGIRIARAQRKLTVLDAGCGTGNGLRGLKEQISFRAPIPEEEIDAVGVTLGEYGEYFRGGPAERRRLTNGYVSILMGNLACMPLNPEYFDLAYSFEVLMHNDRVAPILANVVSSLRPGGEYYFNSLVRQLDEVEGFADGQDVSLESEKVTARQLLGTSTRIFYKLTKA